MRMTQDNDTRLASLRLGPASVVLVCGTETVDVPQSCAQRCGLIGNLLAQTNVSHQDMPLPLAIDEMKAWLAAAQPRESRYGVDSSAPFGEDAEMLLQALKAADFFGDSHTIESISRPLIRLIIGEHVDDRDLELKRCPPSAEECARASRIVLAVPRHCLPSVLGAISRDSDLMPYSLCSRNTRARPLHSSQPDSRELAQLLRLLPRSFHPAVVRFCCRSDADPAALTFPPMPACRQTCSAHRAWLDPDACGAADAGNTSDEIDGDTPCGPSCASMLFQLLAAAAPLAGGSLDLAWDPDSYWRLLRGGSGALCSHSVDVSAGDHLLFPEAGCGPSEGPGEGRAAKRLCLRQLPSEGEATPAALGHSTAAPGQECQRPAITKLSFLLSSDAGGDPGTGWCSRDEEPPRWCAALAQLRTLRELRITAFDPACMSVRALRPALQALPALRTLHLRCEAIVDTSEREDPYEEMGLLLEGVAEVTQLASLTMRECFFFGELDPEDWDDDAVSVAPAQISALSRLTGLTSLAVELLVAGPEGGGAFVRAVKMMAGLRELDVYMRVCGTDGGEVMRQLCTTTCLTALDTLRLRGLLSASIYDRQPAADVRRRLQRISRANPALMARVTALDLSDNCECERYAEGFVSGLVAMLARMRALQSLRLGGNQLGDGGLERLAAVLPRLPRLTLLDVGGTGATHKGVCAILEAAVKATGHYGGVGAGALGLREVDVSCGRSDPGSAAEHARLLRLMKACKALKIEIVGLPVSEQYQHRVANKRAMLR